MAAGREQNLYPEVAVGSTVQTADGKNIGAIAELKGRFFRIKTGRFQRDYWLRADSVRAAAPGQPVILNVPNEQLEAIKMVDTN